MLDDLRTLRARSPKPQTKGLPVTDKPEPKDAKEPRPIIHLGMMGYGTEEQNLGERGDPAKRITEDEADAAFNPPAPRKKP